MKINNLKLLMMALLATSISAVQATVFVPGLAQGTLSGSFNRTDNILTAGTVAYTPGAIMANTSSSAKDLLGGTHSWGDNKTFGYVGKIYFGADTTYIFMKSIDDNTYIKIDGTVIIENTSYNTITSGTFTSGNAGWYDIEIRVGNGTGGAGVANGAKYGIAYNGIGDTNQSNFKSMTEGWIPLTDEGGTHLRYVLSEDDYFTVNSVFQDGDDLVVNASFAGVPSDATFIAYYGGEDGKTNPSSWGASSTLASISAGDTATREYRIIGAGKSKYVAFCLDVTVGESAPAVNWSNTFIFDDLPAFNIAIDKITHSTLSFEATCVSIGSGATYVTADVQLASDPDFNNIVQTKRLALNSFGSEIVVFSGLTPEATYYARVVAINDAQKEGYSSFIYETTYSTGPTYTLELSGAHIAPSVSLSFIRAGGNAEKVDKITIQVSDSGNFMNPNISKTFNVNLTSMPTNVADFVLGYLPVAPTLYYRVIAYNDAGYSTTIDAQVDLTYTEGDNVWSGLSENISESNAYIFEGGLPNVDKKLYFTTPAGLSPVINEDKEMPSLYFTPNAGTSVDGAYLDGYHSCGYNLSGTGVLTFNEEKPIVQASKGTNVVWNPILFNRANNQTAYISGAGGRLNIMGELMLPEGVSNTTLRVNGEGGEVHFGGPSPDFMGTLFLESSFTLYLDNPHSVTNVNKIFFEGGWGSYTYLNNNTGAPMVFPRCSSIDMTTGWSSTRVNFRGAPFIFPGATLTWRPRATDSSSISADLIVKNLILAKNGSNGSAILDKLGNGALIITDTTEWDGGDYKHLIRLRGGCFYPQTSAGLPPSGEFYVDQENSYVTLGLSGDYSPMLDGSAHPRVFQGTSKSRWGFTGFGGDRTVCWNNDPLLNLTNATSDAVSTKLTDTVSLNVNEKTYDTYYAYPSRFMFGNRSEFADGTIIFQNPIRYELGQNWDTSTYFESTNHVVSARLRGSLKLGHRDRTWKFSGNSFGGYLALEAENTDFTGHVSVLDKGNLLVNSNLVARSLTVQSGSGLGGTGALSTESGTTIKSGGALFGGEWNKGGTLLLDGNVTLESGSALRVEVGESMERVGCVELSQDSVLKLTAPIYIDVDTDPRISPIRGSSQKILDWSATTFNSGAAPKLDDFVVRPESNPDISQIFISVREDGLYVGYVSKRSPDVLLILVK